jgi:hypothetical protein
MRLMLIILIVLLLCGGIGEPALGYSYGWGTMAPIGGVVLLLVILLLLGIV